MTPELDLLHETLSQNGLSLTKARLAVFDSLSGREPQTMMEIIKKVNGNADRASVYRTVSVFERLGVVHRLNMGWKYKLELNDGFMHHHHHMTCISCGIVIPLEENHELEERILELPRVQNFLATDHQLEIRGICSSCQRKTN